MIGIKTIDGDIIFGERVEGLDEFVQRVVNSLSIYSDETFYDEKLGLDINVIDNQKYAVYKMEHIRDKLMNWYRAELEDLQYNIISEEERIIKANFYFKHKKYGEFNKEVTIDGRLYNKRI